MKDRVDFLQSVKGALGQENSMCSVAEAWEGLDVWVVRFLKALIGRAK